MADMTQSPPHSPRAEGRTLAFNVASRKPRHGSQGAAQSRSVGLIPGHSFDDLKRHVDITFAEGNRREDVGGRLHLDRAHLGASLPFDLFEHRKRDLPRAPKFPVTHPAAGLSSLGRNSAGRLAHTLTGARPLSFHVRKSSVSRVSLWSYNHKEVPRCQVITPRIRLIAPRVK